jgi:hypothetical protein
MTFWKEEVAQKGYHFELLFTEVMFYIFTKISSHKTWSGVGIFKFQKWFKADLLDLLI